MKKTSNLSVMRRRLPGVLTVAMAVVGAAGATSCHTSSQAVSESQPAVEGVSPSAADALAAYRMSPGPAALPNARIYRTSIDVDALVPVTVDPVSGKIISYPAPSDITGASMPVVLRGGWLLDRRGISPNTRFIRYTYSQYHDLTEAPSPAQIAESIVPDARVTEIVELPYRIGEVTPAMADSIIADGLKRCDVTYKAAGH